MQPSVAAALTLALAVLLAGPAASARAATATVPPAGRPGAEPVPGDGPAVPPAAPPGPLEVSETARLRGLPFGLRLLETSAAFLGLPYLDSPLGEGHGSDPDPPIRFDAVDCLTYVETVLALANAGRREDVLPLMTDLRYAGGRTEYAARHHLMMAQWVPANVAKGYLRDVAREVAGDRVVRAEKRITAESWAARQGTPLQLVAAQVPLGVHALDIIPVEVFPRVLESLPEGALILVVRRDYYTRPNRVTHLGFVVRRGRHVLLRHAARAGWGRVVDERLADFVARAAAWRKWPVDGFAVLLPVDNAERARRLSGPSPSAASPAG